MVSTGDLDYAGGVAGAMLGFVLGGVMISLSVWHYAELTTAMPQNGGEHVFSYRALGKMGSFICTWAIDFRGIRVLSVLKPAHCRRFSSICTPDSYSTIYILSAGLIYMQPG